MSNPFDTSTYGPTPRQRFRRERQRRQNITFSVVFAALAGLVVISLLVLNGIIPLPIGQTFNAEEKFAEVGDVPCPPANTLPVAAEMVKVQVLNATSRQGIAGEATALLQAAGFTPLEPGNSAEEYAGRVRISAGPSAVAQAYTVARFFPGAQVVLSGAADDLVIVELGEFFDGGVAQADLANVIGDQSALVAPSNCLPLKDGVTSDNNAVTDTSSN
ncbi:LytR C-terminal domain-containing protein [Schaalia suimastitidis]|uniref:LytR C-terminal domain-containing protein n=1 Tax=Schaalia suimastitidis TaxID=121163 RepID=UPI00041EF5A3|nr:LytR C-terminal domain-containing protein [Schaalia suimastitidis]